MEYLYVDFPINNPLSLELAKWSLQENNRIKSNKLVKLAKKYEEQYVKPKDTSRFKNKMPLNWDRPVPPAFKKKEKNDKTEPKLPLNSKTPMLLNWTKAEYSDIVDCESCFPNIKMRCQKEVLKNVQISNYMYFDMCRFYCEKGNKDFYERFQDSSPYGIELQFKAMCRNCILDSDVL